MNYLRNKNALLCFLISVVSISLTQVGFAQTHDWQHPGVLVSKAQLEFVRQQVNAKAEPFYQEFLDAKTSHYGSKTYKLKGPYPGGVIQCGSHSTPNNGCTAASSDSAAAYVQALLWYITEDPVYAHNAIRIMNAYATDLKGFAGFTPGYPCPGNKKTCSNGPLQAAWDASKWPRAAEIIRYGHEGRAGWQSTDIKAFSAMLKNIYEPLIYKGSPRNGNWELSMIEAMMGIAVFNEDISLLQRAQHLWTLRVPAYFYNFALDNSQYPHAHAPFPLNKTARTDWNGQVIFNETTTGVAQETCRDLDHTEDGIASTINAAETDYIQGGDLTAHLYTANGAQERLVTSLNLMAGLELSRSTIAPPNFCTQADNIIHLGISTTYVIGYNEYHNRLQDPNMADASGKSGLIGTANTYSLIHRYILPMKQVSDGGVHMALFEALTHYANAPT